MTADTPSDAARLARWLKWLRYTLRDPYDVRANELARAALVAAIEQEVEAARNLVQPQVTAERDRLAAALAQAEARNVELEREVEAAKRITLESVYGKLKVPKP